VIKKLCWSLALGQSLLWVSSVVLFPPAAAAYTAEDLLTVSWLAGEDYLALARRAEVVARAAAQQGFDTDILLTRVVITVLGQNGGQTAPILKLDVGRNDWRQRPDPRYWASYYRSTPALLGLEGVAPTGILQANPAASAPGSPASSHLPGTAPTTPSRTGSGSTSGSASENGSGNTPRNSPTNTNQPAPSQSGGPTNGTTSPPSNRPTNNPHSSGESPSSTNSGKPPTIKLPAVPAEVGIPQSILQ